MQFRDHIKKLSKFSKSVLKNVTNLVKYNIKNFYPILITYTFCTIVANINRFNIISFSTDNGLTFFSQRNNQELILFGYVFLLFIHFLFSIKYILTAINNGFLQKQIQANNFALNLKSIIKSLIVTFTFSILYLFLFLPIIIISLFILFLSFSFTSIFVILILTRTIYIEILFLFLGLFIILTLILFFFYISGNIVTFIRYCAIQNFRESFYFNHTLYLVKKYWAKLVYITLLWIFCQIFINWFVLEKSIFLESENSINYLVLVSKILLVFVSPILLNIYLPYSIGMKFREIVEKENQEYIIKNDNVVKKKQKNNVF